MKTQFKNRQAIHIEDKGYGMVIGWVGYPTPNLVRVQFKSGKEKGFTGEVVDYNPEKLARLNTIEPLL